VSHCYSRKRVLSSWNHKRFTVDSNTNPFGSPAKSFTKNFVAMTTRSRFPFRCAKKPPMIPLVLTVGRVDEVASAVQIPLEDRFGVWDAGAHPRSSPNVVVPRQNGLTFSPERPSVT
jgi:hypothetical protein